MSDYEELIKPSKVPCLLSVEELEKFCLMEGIHFSEEANMDLLLTTLNKLGSSASQKIAMKLVDMGEVSWEKEADFEVESILDYVESDGIHFYLIKWKGWSNKHNTWEPESNLECTELMADYITKYHTDPKIAEKYEKVSYKRPKQDNDEIENVPKRQKNLELVNRILSRNQEDTDKRITPCRILELALEFLPRNSKLFDGLRHNTKLKSRRIARAQRHISNKRGSAYKRLKTVTEKALQQWEREINQVNTDPAVVKVENTIDLEGPPPNFVYIAKNFAGEGITIPNDPLVGCECKNCYEEKKSCCGVNAGSAFAYYRVNNHVRIMPGFGIYECNSKCACGPDCANRVVQHGRRCPLIIFRTNSRGWGVKAMKRIKSGTFVMEYVGEVITHEEGEKRGREYDSNTMTYLFDLDYNLEEDGYCPYTIDAAQYGNVSHFVNHSCDPNLVVYTVWINTLNPFFPRIALFAKRDICAGEELTFDYKMTGATQSEEVAPIPENEVDGKTGDINGDTSEKLQPLTSDIESNFIKPDPSIIIPHKEIKEIFQESATEPFNNTIEKECNNNENFPKMTESEPVSFTVLNKGLALTESMEPPNNDTDKDSACGESIIGEKISLSEEKKSLIKTASENSTCTSSECDSVIDDKESVKSEQNSLNDKSDSLKIPTSPPPATKYRLRCRCGASKCRGWLY